MHLTPSSRRTPLLTASVAAALAASSTMLASCSLGSLNFKKEAAATLTTPALAELHVSNQVGSVELKADSSATSITATATRIGKGVTQADADAALAETSATLAPDPGGKFVLAIGKQPSSSGMSKGYEIKWSIVAPPTTMIVVKTNVGEVELTGFTQGADVKVDVGKITGTALAGGGSFTSNVGKVSVSTQAPVTAHSDTGSVSLTLTPGGAGNVKASSNVGSVSLVLASDWTGSVTADSNVGSVNSSIPGAAIKSNTTGKSMTATIGAGAAKAEASSNVGSVSVSIAGTH